MVPIEERLTALVSETMSTEHVELARRIYEFSLEVPRSTVAALLGCPEVKSIPASPSSMRGGVSGLGSGVEWRGSSGKCPAFRHDGVGGSKCGIGAARSPRFSRCCARALSVIGTA